MVENFTTFLFACSTQATSRGCLMTSFSLFWELRKTNSNHRFPPAIHGRELRQTKIKKEIAEQAAYASSLGVLRGIGKFCECCGGWGNLCGTRAVDVHYLVGVSCWGQQLRRARRLRLSVRHGDLHLPVVGWGIRARGHILEALRRPHQGLLENTVYCLGH
jgi:hypothetical protein